MSYLRQEEGMYGSFDPGWLQDEAGNELKNLGFICRNEGIIPVYHFEEATEPQGEVLVVQQFSNPYLWLWGLDHVGKIWDPISEIKWALHHVPEAGSRASALHQNDSAEVVWASD